MTQDKGTLENMSDTPAKNDRLVWIDLEMTGLDTHRHVIVEVAALITDADLNILGEGVDLVVHATDAQLAEMDDYVTAMHENSGLTQEIRSSTVSIEEAEDAVLELIAKHCDPQHPAPLAGNSIATDRSFINAYMPRLDNALHYRMVDVSSVKELARRWAPRVYFNQPQKGMAHRALADIIESIRELAYYRRALFKEDLTTSECNDASAQATQSYQQFLQ
ncbi:oligoribonuclease [Corynebacterium pseudotuberculosis]|uniref:Oligoribonuclease n=1 Tax=Corynebacterium pseudotuberculosis 258 TaxID=1168865 RepID=A0AAU8Q766_CORPS|nr:oligoribonuclease [Corynebacterium pseudotuberculosis]AEQ07165.1 oligoribonuclease [Corynebacterium pseudotuberculosis CIP 52.97]AFB72975.2 oligoribonuclease [Corynebacterium pseudotuberculosis 316]AFH91432.2 oligoribonuclease [Corynebacterium pseudotuberculosis 31]AFK17263.2 oligoribonuclease [Corynebacterium pseudotuberculosis 258]AMN70941.2 oligoribonuclease [Corynebacterium pseudotuberculosis]